MNESVERLTLGLNELACMDPGGVRLALHVTALASREAVEFSIVPPAPMISRIFELAGVARRPPDRTGEAGSRVPGVA